MAQAGNSFCICLTPSQLDCGKERYTNSRPVKEVEAYFSLPKKYAKEYNLFNSDNTTGNDILGENILIE